MVRIIGTVEFSGSDAPKGTDAAYKVIHRFAADAVFGSFGDFPSDYFAPDKWQAPPKDLVSVRVEAQAVDGFRFVLEIPQRLLGTVGAAYQHLIGILAGDLFDGQIPDLQADWSVQEIELGENLRDSVDGTFGREVSHTADSVRDSFALEAFEPLLAFSLKPRYGLTREAITEIVIGVLAAGFHVVEFDTRCLSTDPTDLDFLDELAGKASEAAPERVTRLSLNVSGATALVDPVLDRLAATHGPPHVLKVDGGLDGISTLQHVRRTQGAREWNPILTCYPLLRRALTNRVPPEFFVQALVQSGADIIYPGGRPSLTEGIRNLWAERPDGVIQSVERYHRIAKMGRPMPTIAGGVYLGEMHAYMDLLGPNVPFFLGGAIALHREGPIEGARTCRRIVDAVLEARSKDPGAQVTPNLPAKLIAEVEGAYPGDPDDANRFRYVSPRQVLEETKHLSTWFGG